MESTVGATAMIFGQQNECIYKSERTKNRDASKGISRPNYDGSSRPKGRLYGGLRFGGGHKNRKASPAKCSLLTARKNLTISNMLGPKGGQRGPKGGHNA